MLDELLNFRRRGLTVAKHQIRLSPHVNWAQEYVDIGGGNAEFYRAFPVQQFNCALRVFPLQGDGCSNCGQPVSLNQRVQRTSLIEVISQVLRHGRVTRSHQSQRRHRLNLRVLGQLQRRNCMMLRTG